MTNRSAKFEEHVELCDRAAVGPIEKFLLVSSLESMYQGYADALSSFYQMMMILQMMGGDDPFTQLSAYKTKHPQLAETCDTISQMYWYQKELKDVYHDAYQHLREAISTGNIGAAPKYLTEKSQHINELREKIHVLNMKAIGANGDDELQQFLDFMKGDDDDDLSENT